MKAHQFLIYFVCYEKHVKLSLLTNNMTYFVNISITLKINTRLQHFDLTSILFVIYVLDFFMH